MIKQCLLAIGFLCISHSQLLAYNVTINGEARTYKGQEIAAYHYSNLVTKSREILQTAIIEDDGSFKLSINIDQCEQLFFRIGYVNADMYVQPEANYTITIPALPDSVPVSINNTNRVDVIITGYPKYDINLLINDFNNRAFLFASQYINRINTKAYAAQIDTFKLELDSLYKTINHTYFKVFVNYAIAEMKLNSAASKKAIYEQFILNQPIRYQHHAYVAFIKLFYENYLYRFDVKRNNQEVLSAIDFQKSYNALMATMLQDDFLKNVQLAELIILVGLADLADGEYCSKNGIINILALAKELCRFSENKQIAKELHGKLTQFTKGYPAPNFALYNKRSQLISLSDLKGKHIYLQFWATWCSDCVRHMAVMEELQEKYGKDIAFVSISIDQEKQDMLRFLEKNPTYDWHILYGGSDIFIKEKFGVHTVPMYFLIDNEGKFSIPNAKAPDNNIGPYLSEIQRKLHPIMRLVPGK